MPPTPTEGEKPAVSQKFIVVANQKFYIVTCALMFLKFLGDYLNFLDQLPGFESEVAHRLVEIVHVFNSRTCQMILGGGALAISGLKAIKTRHLGNPTTFFEFLTQQLNKKLKKW